MENAKAPAREVKHMSILHGIHSLERANQNLESLILDVSGQDKPPEEVAKEGREPNLVHVLDTAGAALTQLAERIVSNVKDLKGMIL